MSRHHMGMDQIPSFTTVGQRLDWWMTRRKRKQTELAKAAGMAQSALSQIISGRSKAPAAEHMLRLAKELQLSPEYLVWGEGPPETLHFSQLSGLEAQLVMLFRGLPDDAKRDAMLIDVNDFHNRHAAKPGVSAANPWAHVAPPPTMSPPPKPGSKAKAKGKADADH
uniref:Putative DNA binding, helix-turn-helix domain containing protein n=1 Tax=viral metagenome TaxID=1070528 RepID=A0A6M3M7P6_9ZZZZ